MTREDRRIWIRDLFATLSGPERVELAQVAYEELSEDGAGVVRDLFVEDRNDELKRLRNNGWDALDDLKSSIERLL